MAAPVTYSFNEVKASIVGPGGAFSLGAGSGAAEEGITIEPREEFDTLTIGADGSAMHSLHMDKSAKLIFRLLKTSPVNAQLNLMKTLQRASGALHGLNVIVIRQMATNDVITCQIVAFAKEPVVTYAKEGGIMEWEFFAGIVDRTLGFGT